eukprot:TRINITY_DN7960_c0_g1_i1.p1 TRINITY_DN7960_c0_g1~~TRINITY_DN7960_c0_g1_i1.p1  ORF type:complete len:445 (+),score=183.20 TRINITY_DN7960_c0_g1_i1:132-1337(+)
MNDSKAMAIKKQLGDAFLNLETSVLNGRQKIMEEHTRQKNIRQENNSRLQKNLNGLKREYVKEVERLIKIEKAEADLVEKQHKQLREKIEVDIDESVFMLSMQETEDTDVICEELREKSPEYRFVKLHFEQSLQDESLRKQFKLARVYRIHSPYMQKVFDDVKNDIEEESVTGDDCIERLYFWEDRNTMREIVEQGFETVFGTPVKTPIVLHRDVGDQTQSGFNGGGKNFVVLMCRVLKLNTFADEEMELDDHLNGFQSLLDKQYDSVDVQQDNVVLGLQCNHIIPEYYIRFQVRDDKNASKVTMDTEMQFNDFVQELLLKETSHPQEYSTLRGLEKEVQQQFQEHHQRLWTHLDPTTAALVAERDAEIEMMRKNLESLKKQIRAERSLQEALVRDIQKRE